MVEILPDRFNFAGMKILEVIARIMLGLVFALLGGNRQSRAPRLSLPVRSR